MKDKATVNLYPLEKNGSVEGGHEERPRKWKLRTVSFLKFIFRFVTFFKFALDIYDKFLKWMDEF